MQLICKLNGNVILSEPCARGNHSHLMSSEGPFIGSQGIQGTLLPFKLVSIIFIKGYELLHVLGKINPLKKITRMTLGMYTLHFV